MKNANVDYCGMINLLRCLLQSGNLTEKEARKVAARLMSQSGASLMISL